MLSTVVEVKDDCLLLRVSEESLESPQLRPGDQVELTTAPQRGRVRRRYALGQLLKEHQEIQHLLPQDREWIDAPRVGRELL